MTTKEFFQYASEHHELCEKMIACTSPEECYAIAQGEGLTDDFELFKATATKLNSEATELSTDDLDVVTAAGSLTAATITAATTVFAFGASAAM